MCRRWPPPETDISWARADFPWGVAWAPGRAPGQDAPFQAGSVRLPGERTFEVREPIFGLTSNEGADLRSAEIRWWRAPYRSAAHAFASGEATHDEDPRRLSSRAPPFQREHAPRMVTLRSSSMFTIPK